MNIKNIIFDFGGVLVNWDPRYLYNDLFDNKEEMEYFLTHICSPEWNTMQDAGRPLEEGTRVLIQKFPEHSNMIRKFYDEWETMLRDEIPANVQLLSRLKQDYRLLGLTNWSSETLPHALDRFPFFGLFEGIVVSGDEKLVKPDYRIFHVLTDRYDIKPEESVFIDDNRENIVAAGELGFNTIHFANGIIVEEQLKEMNVL